MTEYIKFAFELLFSGDKELWKTIAVTAEMSLFSTTISCLIGIPIGVILALSEFRGKGVVMRVLNTLMSLPPVLAGLIILLLFRSKGKLKYTFLAKIMGLELFTVNIMVLAQVFLITPIVASLTCLACIQKTASLKETSKGLGFSKTASAGLMIRDNKASLLGILATAFGRSIAEVGAVQIVGGNIMYKTRVMTTSIMLESNKGNFEYAVALGIVLLTLSLIVNSIAYTFQQSSKEKHR